MLASAAISKCFLAMQRIERDDGIFADAQFGEQALRGRDFVGLLSNVDVGEQEGSVGRERAQYLSCSAVIEVVEAASQCLAIQRDAALPGGRTCGLQQGGMAAEDRLDRGRIEPLKDVADRGVRRCAAPVQTESGVQLAAVHVDECDDASIRVATGHDSKDGKQQHVWQL